jgi:hypothetical protein
MQEYNYTSSNNSFADESTNMISKYCETEQYEAPKNK